MSIDPGWVADHGYPAQWYYDTIAVPGTAGSDTYGFIRSLEGGGDAEWLTSLGLPLGNPGARTFKVKFANHHWDEGPLTPSETGHVITDVDGLAMETGSAVSGRTRRRHAKRAGVVCVGRLGRRHPGPPVKRRANTSPPQPAGLRNPGPLQNVRMGSPVSELSCESGLP